uniref:Uncharacterized protein n=1 Tax=Glossina brevipalpis TaxID=37001 RepID=A0A1A9W0D3_9MUSC
MFITSQDSFKEDHTYLFIYLLHMLQEYYRKNKRRKLYSEFKKLLQLTYSCLDVIIETNFLAFNNTNNTDRGYTQFISNLMFVVVVNAIFLGYKSYLSAHKYQISLDDIETVKCFIRHVLKFNDLIAAKSTFLDAFAEKKILAISKVISFFVDFLNQFYPLTCNFS